jgi:hypothetical protein
MENVSFPERFDRLELLRDEGEVQTFRARERATGRAVEAHFSTSPELLAKLDSPNVMDRGSHDGKLYVVTTSQGLDSVGAWRIKPSIETQQKAETEPKAPPGDFTRMFELHQAPEPLAAPAARAVESPAVSQPGEFTRAFEKPAAAPVGSPVPAASIPASPAHASEGLAPVIAQKRRVPVGLIVSAILIISAIAVFVLVRTLY